MCCKSTLYCGFKVSLFSSSTSVRVCESSSPIFPIFLRAIAASELCDSVLLGSVETDEGKEGARHREVKLDWRDDEISWTCNRVLVGKLLTDSAPNKNIVINMIKKG
ncbi:uncharacterized protein G2W53_003472 [Senna tora]|uniref:Uncharacterized protein n=1 Tax=Senna tora TaxID=362788 RepID=A0A834XBL0_9FABA|nr:uncharacterized protein G2W53_003472 [Senna tora]